MVGKVRLLEVVAHIGLELARDLKLVRAEIDATKAGLGAQAAIALGDTVGHARQSNGRPPAVASRDQFAPRCHQTARFLST